MSVRVLHVLEAIEGGTARHLSKLVRYVDAEHVVAVPAERVGGLTDTAALEAMGAAGARVEVVPMRRSVTSPRNAAAVARVRRLIRNTRPDVVHGHSSIGGAVARLAAVGTGTPRVYTPNGLFPARVAYAVERALGRLTDVLVAASSSEAKLVQHLRIAPPVRIVIVPNAIELESPPPASVDLRAELGIDTETPLVGSVGRLVRQKAPEVFVRACARVAASVPQARFVLVGGGPLEGLVTSEIASAGLDDRFLLLRGFDEGERIMGQFDVFALPSRYEAGAAFAPMEAMRAGTPVVVTDVVGSRDAVEHGRSGFVVPPDDSAALADAVTRLLVDPALRRAFSDAGRRRVAERFDIRMAAVGIAEVYGSLARGEAERSR